MELFVLFLLGGASYLWLTGNQQPSASAGQQSPTPVTSATSPTGSTTVATPGTTISSAGVSSGAGGSTTMSASPAMPSDAQIAQATLALAPKMSASWQKAWVSLCTQQLGTKTMSASTTDNCSGYSSSNTTFKAVTGLAAGGATIGAGAAAGAGIIASAAVPVIGIAIAGITALITGIFQHHAAKVTQQAQLDCAGCAAANNAWSEIVNAIEEGTFNASQAQQAFESVAAQFTSLVGPMNNAGPGDCNGPCGLNLICRAICTKYELEYGLPTGGPA